MFPTQRRQVLQQLAVHRLTSLDQPLGGAFQIHCVPQHDSRRHQVEAAGPVALLLEAPIPDFAEAVEEHRPGQGVARFTLVGVWGAMEPKTNVSSESHRKGAFRSPAHPPGITL